MKKPKLIIMVGNIASGKTTWIKSLLVANPTYRVVSLDAIRRMFGGGKYAYDLTLEPLIESIGLAIIMKLMAKGINIVMDETNETLGERARWLNVTNWHNRIGYDYQTIAAVMPFVDRHESLDRRMKGRDLAWGFDRQVWDTVWSRKDDLYIKPKHSEGFDEIWEAQTDFRSKENSNRFYTRRTIDE